MPVLLGHLGSARAPLSPLGHLVMDHLLGLESPQLQQEVGDVENSLGVELRAFAVENLRLTASGQLLLERVFTTDGPQLNSHRLADAHARVEHRRNEDELVIPACQHASAFREQERRERVDDRRRARCGLPARGVLAAVASGHGRVAVDEACVDGIRAQGAEEADDAGGGPVRVARVVQALRPRFDLRV